MYQYIKPYCFLQVYNFINFFVNKLFIFIETKGSVFILSSCFSYFICLRK